MLKRRSILRLGAGCALALVSPDLTYALKPGSREQDEETEALLKELLFRRAVPMQEPWMEMHVVLAFGSEFKRNGKNLLDDLVARILRTETVEMRQYPYFPLDVERHPFHMLQVMQAAGVPYDRAFVTPQGRFTRRELVDSSTAILKQNEIYDELSWVVSVLCNEFPPDKDRFETVWGEEVVVSDIVGRHLKETEAAYADVFAVMKGGKLYGKGALHARACNGLHLLYGLIEAIRFGYRADDLQSRVERLVEATLFRARLEPLLIDRGMPGTDQAVRLNRDAAKFTFFGHLIEVLGYVHRYSVLEFGSGLTGVMAKLRGELATLTVKLTTGYDLGQLQKHVPQAYKLVLGDACHAYRGIRFWT